MLAADPVGIHPIGQGVAVRKRAAPAPVSDCVPPQHLKLRSLIPSLVANQEEPMTEAISPWRAREIIEDRLEAATGEPRHVTDIEIEFSPEQDDAPNWSADARCKREYAPALDKIMDEVKCEFPLMDFA
jgi:hypothetical protein